MQVIEVKRPDRQRRRRQGKNDMLDAEAAARAVLSGDATATPKDRSGAVGEIRALLVARRSAVKARTQCINQLKALLVHAPDELRDRLTHRRTSELVARCSRIHATDGTKQAIRSLARRWQALDCEAVDLQRTLRGLVQQAVPKLLQRPGINTITAAQLLVTAADNPDRLRSEAAFAALCGVSPVDASSGRTTRHRLNRGGDRAANTALWTIAHVRLVHDPRTQISAAKRSALA